MNDWTSEPTEQRPLCVEDLQSMFKQINERDKRDRELLAEFGRECESRRHKDPRRFDAEMQASIEIFGRYGDPVNPIICHPDTLKRYSQRVEDLLNERTEQ